MGKSIKSGMNAVIIGELAANFFISVSMKQILKAIQILQIIAFLVFI